jgi:transposase
MPGAISQTLRESILERHLAGENYRTIAEALHLSRWTVRQICRRYRQQGMMGLATNYSNCGQRGCRSDRRVRRGAIWLKRHHPRWGGRLIRVVLQQRWPERVIPHSRTLQRWFAESGVNTPPQRRVAIAPPRRATRVHEVWQMDGVEHVSLADGQEVSWITLTDEYSHALLATVVFPPPASGTSPTEYCTTLPARRVRAVGVAAMLTGR